MRHRRRRVGTAAIALFAAIVVASSEASAAVTKLESQCAGKLAKGSASLSKTLLKELADCRADEIASDGAASCPTMDNTDKIEDAEGKLAEAAAKSCVSTCSRTTTVACLADRQCPPFGALRERCTGGGDAPFDMGHIGFPGAVCEAVLGGSIDTTGDLADCVASVTGDSSETFIDVVYGSLDESSGASDEALECLAAISKSGRKLVATVVKGVGKCRLSILAGKTLANPATCASDDPKLADKIAKAEDKLAEAMTEACPPAVFAELDLCGNGVGATSDVTAAIECVTAAAREIADSDDAPVLRSYGPRSIIDAAFPPAAAVCGDDAVNQLPDAHLLLGEECDGSDDSACPGQCLPPGDLFECTCGDIPRHRVFYDGLASDTDVGWTGITHDQIVAEDAGYVVDVSNCNCSEITGATCTGTTSDSVCDIQGRQLPVCSYDPNGSTSCDVAGNNDGLDEDSDCYVCDEFNLNSGEPCEDESDCDGQCYEDGTATGTPCAAQIDCPVDQVCRGQCDRTQTCLVIPIGGPLPVVTTSTAACNLQVFRSDMTGTRDLETGAHEIYYDEFTRNHVGESVSVPCPLCGGFCEGGSKDGEICLGRCSGGGEECRFDTECTSGETCLGASPECPNGSCQLSLVCRYGPNEGEPCIAEYQHPYFGTMSNDCPPHANKNITGRGLEVAFQPGTSYAVSLPAAVPCTAPGFQLFECPCPDDDGAPTKPNACTPACNQAGADFGIGCANGNSSGTFTRCEAGANDGQACDEDADCPDGACSDNPTHCTGDPAFERFTCTSNGDCGAGECVDACAGGRCVPLCVPALDDAEEGVCAGGPPAYHCAGAGYVGIDCTAGEATDDCDASCSESETPCTSQSDCPQGEECEGTCTSHKFCEAGEDGVLGNDDDRVGAGACIEYQRNCFLDPVPAEGGSTLNGNGDPSNGLTVTTWCINASDSGGPNTAAGFGGPARNRIRWTATMNVESIP